MKEKISNRKQLEEDSVSIIENKMNFNINEYILKLRAKKDNFIMYWIFSLLMSLIIIYNWSVWNISLLQWIMHTIELNSTNLLINLCILLCIIQLIKVYIDDSGYTKLVADSITINESFPTWVALSKNDIIQEINERIDIHSTSASKNRVSDFFIKYSYIPIVIFIFLGINFMSGYFWYMLSKATWIYLIRIIFTFPFIPAILIMNYRSRNPPHLSAPT